MLFVKFSNGFNYSLETFFLVFTKEIDDFLNILFDSALLDIWLLCTNLQLKIIWVLYRHIFRCIFMHIKNSCISCNIDKWLYKCPHIFVDLHWLISLSKEKKELKILHKTKQKQKHSLPCFIWVMEQIGVYHLDNKMNWDFVFLFSFSIIIQ